MFNVGGGEFFVIVLLALVVLGPDKLPGAMRTVGQWAGEMRKMANGFQSQMNDAMNAVTVDVKSSEKPSDKPKGSDKPTSGAKPSDTPTSGANGSSNGANGSSARPSVSNTDVAAAQQDPAGDAPAAEAE